MQAEEKGTGTNEVKMAGDTTDEGTKQNNRVIINLQSRRMKMSIVIIGGNECMVCQYEKICKDYGCKAKVFAKEKGCLRKKLGNPDLMILFTNTVSHKMVNTAVAEAKKNRIRIARTHSSSATALTDVLETYCR